MTRQHLIFPRAKELPRGPHGLGREEVAASQRGRILAAVAEVVGDYGYASSTVAAICQAAGVSPRSFYEHFESKLECFLTAYEHFAETLLERMAAALDPQAGWRQFVESTLSAYLGSLEDDPLAARAFLVEGEAAGPRARALRREALGRFASLIRIRHEQIRAVDPSLAPLPEVAYLGLVHGVRALACEEIETSEQPRLRALAPPIVIWLQAAVLGAAEAHEAP